MKKKAFPATGRLASFLIEGGKIRYIAIGNWVIQSVLKPLHDLLIRVSRSLRADCTYDQSKVFRWYSEIIGKKRNRFFSIDLTAATDRIPLGIQRSVIEGFLGPKIAKL
jgi:hypothetical protein